MWCRLNAPGGRYEGRAFEDVEFHPDRLERPLRMKKPQTIFVDSMSDLFHETISFPQIAAVFGAMASALRHTFLVLTKRPTRAACFFEWLERHRTPDGCYPSQAQLCERYAQKYGLARAKAETIEWPLPNVWMGTSVENQWWADKRIPALIDCPAAGRFLSVEPLLGSLDLGRYLAPAWKCDWCGSLFASDEPHTRGDDPDHASCTTCGRVVDWSFGERPIGWVIVGGESGPKARPMSPSWARGVRDQCAAAGVLFFFKQWGEWAPDVRFETVNGRFVAERLDPDESMTRVGKKNAGHMLDGRAYHQLPERANR